MFKTYSYKPGVQMLITNEWLSVFLKLLIERNSLQYGNMEHVISNHSDSYP